MAKRRVGFEMQIDVEFIDEEAIQKHIIDGDEWKSVFFTLEDIEDLASHIAYVFHNENELFVKGRFVRFVEGFGEFIKQDDGSYLFGGLEVGPTGDIVVRYELELEPSHTVPVQQ